VIGDHPQSGEVTRGSAVSPRRVERQLRLMGWQSESRREVLARIIGSFAPLPDFAAWGHGDHPVQKPLWAFSCGPGSIARCCERIWKIRPDSILLLNLTADLGTWHETYDVLCGAPSGAAVYLLQVSDLRRGLARRLTLTDEQENGQPTP
jgi:hypothetical protein